MLFRLDPGHVFPRIEGCGPPCHPHRHDGRARDPEQNEPGNRWIDTAATGAEGRGQACRSSPSDADPEGPSVGFLLQV